MTISLDKDIEAFLEEQVRKGACTSASELVNAILRSVREWHQAPLEITPEIENWLLAAADVPTTPLTKSDFEAIRERVRDRAPPSKP